MTNDDGERRTKRRRDFVDFLRELPPAAAAEFYASIPTPSENTDGR